MLLLSCQRSSTWRCIPLRGVLTKVNTKNVISNGGSDELHRPRAHSPPQSVAWPWEGLEHRLRWHAHFMLLIFDFHIHLLFIESSLQLWRQFPWEGKKQSDKAHKVLFLSLKNILYVHKELENIQKWIILFTIKNWMHLIKIINSMNTKNQEEQHRVIFKTTNSWTAWIIQPELFSST